MKKKKESKKVLSNLLVIVLALFIATSFAKAVEMNVTVEELIDLMRPQNVEIFNPTIEPPEEANIGGIANKEKYIIGQSVNGLATTTDLYGEFFSNRKEVFAYRFVAVGSSTNAYEHVGDDVDTIDFTIKALGSEATTSVVNMNIWASNDSECSTTLASSTAGTLLKQTSDIDWYDVTPQLSTSGQTVTLENDFTVWSWPLSGTASTTHIQLTNWNADCIRFRATAATATSTISVEMRTKNLFLPG